MPTPTTTYRDAHREYAALTESAGRVRNGLYDRRRDAQHLAETQRGQIRQALIEALATQDPAHPSLGDPALNERLAQRWADAQGQQALLRDQLGRIDVNAETTALRQAQEHEQALQTSITTRRDARETLPVVRTANVLALDSEERPRVDKVNPWAFWKFSGHDRRQAAGVRRYARQHKESFWTALARDDAELEAIEVLAKERNATQNEQRRHQAQIDMERSLTRQLDQVRFERPHWARFGADAILALSPERFATVLQAWMPGQKEALQTRYAVAESAQRVATGIEPYEEAAQNAYTALKTTTDRLKRALGANAGSRAWAIDLKSIGSSTRATLNSLDQQRAAVALTLPHLESLAESPSTPARRSGLDRSFASAPASSSASSQHAGMSWFWIWMLLENPEQASSYGTALGLPTLNEHLVQHGMTLATLDRLEEPSAVSTTLARPLPAVPGDSSPLDRGTGPQDTWNNLPAEAALPLFGALDVPVPAVDLGSLSAAPVFSMPDVPAFSVPDLPAFTMPDIPSMPVFTMPDLPAIPDVSSISFPDTTFSMPDISPPPDFGSSM